MNYPLPIILKYVDHAGQYCPECNGQQITGHHRLFELGQISQSMSCKCGARWWDVYKLTLIERRT